MGKEEIRYQLEQARSALNSYRTQLTALEDKLSTIETFSAECSSRISAFESSMAKRKSRLLNFESLLDCVKAAARYSQKMSDMLTGAEYTATVSSIDQLQGSISTQRKSIVADIEYAEEQIAILEAKVADLQYEYDTYPEEAVENGG